MANAIGVAVLTLGLIAAFIGIPLAERRFPANRWFVLRASRFEVPRRPLRWRLTWPVCVFGSWAIGAAIDGLPPSAGRALVLGGALIVWHLAITPVSAMISLTPDGLRVWSGYRYRTLPWVGTGELSKRQLRCLAVPPEWVNAIATHYAAHPEDRAAIGTGAEYDRLASYVRAPGTDSTSQLTLATRLPPDVRLP
jgi:hypothetical protein